MHTSQGKNNLEKRILDGISICETKEEDYIHLEMINIIIC